MLKRSLLALVIAVLGAARAYAKNETVTVGVDNADKPIVLPAPKAGENLTVIVEVPVPVKKAAPATVAVPVFAKGASVSLRGGIGWSYFTDEQGVAWTADMVGQVGYRHSPWRLRARFGMGEARYNTRAISGSLAVMYRLFSSGWSLGASVDGLATINKHSHPLENVEEQFGGVSSRVSYQQGGFLAEMFVTFGARGTRAPGDTPEEWGIPLGGVAISYMWGR